MKIKIPRRLELKLNLKKAKDTFSVIGFALFCLLTLTGLVYGIRYVRYQSYYEEKEAECQLVSDYLNDEVLPLATMNVSDCSCHYANEDFGGEIIPNCLCSCELYDMNGTLIDDEWYLLLSTLLSTE